MKKTITLLLTLCLLLCLLPTEAVAYLGDIQTVDSGTVTAKKLNSGSWELRNDYLRVIVRKDGTLSTAPAADSADPVDRQTPFCYFVAYGTKHTTYPGKSTSEKCGIRGQNTKRPGSSRQGGVRLDSRFEEAYCHRNDHGLL